MQSNSSSGSSDRLIKDELLVRALDNRSRHHIYYLTHTIMRYVICKSDIEYS